MRFFTARSLALATLVPALLLFVFVPGCAKQNEGERCGDDVYGPDSSDCDDGLTCKLKTDLLDDGTHRCCYADGHVTDSRCEPKGTAVVPSGGASSGGASSGGASSGGAGASSGGANTAGAAGDSSAAGSSIQAAGTDG